MTDWLTFVVIGSVMSKRGRTVRSGRGGERGRSVAGSGGGVVREARVGFWSGRGGRWLILLLILSGAAIPFGYGKYFEFNTPDPFDSSGFVYSAHRVLDGAMIGFHEKPSAQIGTLWVNMLGVWLFGYSEYGPKLLQGVLQGAALLLMFFVMVRLFGRLAAGVGVMVASLYLSAPFIAKFGNVKEQYMIASSVLAICCVVYQQLGRDGGWLFRKLTGLLVKKWPRLGGRWQEGSWLWGIGAGVCLIWAPMFKQTGLAALGAVGLFLVLQPLWRNRGWKQGGVDILLVWLGIFIGLAPVHFWRKAEFVQGMEMPHEFVWRTLKSVAVLDEGLVEDELRLASMGQGGQEAGEGDNQEPTSYIGTSRALSNLAQQAKVVFRFYGLLILPISLALVSVVLRLVRLIRRWGGKGEKTVYDRFVLLFGVWWLIDMVFVWISPRSYEQYYLPLCASAAMGGGMWYVCGVSVGVVV
ncbi:MAG: hypothetical protein GY869_20825 [Planctomycetes bacterium]|nr:hypothetical protein [Planctomycetota bacterium]